jgi:hypothetical protein
MVARTSDKLARILQESGMDKDKGIVVKTIEAVEEFASEVKDAAKHMMDPDPVKPGDEVAMLPMADDGIFGAPMAPQFMVIHNRKGRSKKPPKKVAKTAAKKAAKKSAKKAAKKVSPKTAKKSKAVVKKTTKKAAKKKKANKSRR